MVETVGEVTRKAMEVQRAQQNTCVVARMSRRRPIDAVQLPDGQVIAESAAVGPQVVAERWDDCNVRIRRLREPCQP
jgi:hypothetical protein